MIATKQIWGRAVEIVFLTVYLTSSLGVILYLSWRSPSIIVIILSLFVAGRAAIRWTLEAFDPYDW